jgi:hypothetical protein
MKHEYHEGPEALKKFEDGMNKLFQAPKAESPFKPPQPNRKKKPARIGVCAFLVLAVY